MSFSPEVIALDASADLDSVLEVASQETFDVSDVEEENDLIVLTTQMSADEIVHDEDVIKTEELILAGREESGVTVYQFSVLGLLKRSAINLVLPFINGMMLGFGEILAHEIGFKYHWVGARVVPERRMTQSKSSQFL